MYGRSLVDENLFYKGVDKHKVEPARLAQHHEATAELNPGQPPYTFHSGDSLLALTKKHNVCGILVCRVISSGHHRSYS